MFLYSYILGHNIVGCLQGCMIKQKPTCYICVYATQYEEALGNTDKYCLSVLGNEVKFQERACLLTANIESPLYWASICTFRVQKTITVHENNSF